MESFDRLVGEIGASPLLLFELHAPVLVLCRAQSALGGLHTRDESMMACKTISLQGPRSKSAMASRGTNDGSTRGKPQMPSIDGCCFCLLVAGSSEASDRWSFLPPTGDSHNLALSPSRIPHLLPHRPCRAAPSRSSRKRLVDVARGSCSYFQPPPVLNMAARRAGKWCLALVRGTAALASIGNFPELTAGHDCPSTAVGRAPWYPGFTPDSSGALGC